MHDPRISALLRLKRFEQPPPGYFDRMLSEVHRRQRSELLHRSLWKIAIERVQVFFSEHSMGNLSYAGAMAAVLVAGVAAIGFMTPGDVVNEPAGGGSLASNEKVAAPVPLTLAGTNRMMVLVPKNEVQVSALGSAPRENAVVASAPRYVIDARPVSYEPAFSF